MTFCLGGLSPSFIDMSFYPFERMRTPSSSYLPQVHFDMDVGQPIIKEDQLFCCVLHALVTLLTYAFPCM